MPAPVPRALAIQQCERAQVVVIRLGVLRRDVASVWRSRPVSFACNCSAIDFATSLDREDVGLLAIEGFSPKVRIVSGSNELHGHTHRVAAFLHRSLHDVSDAKLLCYLRQVFRRSLCNAASTSAITFRSAILDRRVRISFCTPSAK